MWLLSVTKSFKLAFIIWGYWGEASTNLVDKNRYESFIKRHTWKRVGIRRHKDL